MSVMHEITPSMLEMKPNISNMTFLLSLCFLLVFFSIFWIPFPPFAIHSKQSLRVSLGLTQDSSKVILASICKANLSLTFRVSLGLIVLSQFRPGSRLTGFYCVHWFLFLFFGFLLINSYSFSSLCL